MGIVPCQGLQVETANFVGHILRNALLKAGQVPMEGLGWMMAQQAGLCRTAQGQQEEGIGADHLVSFHGGQRPRGLNLQWLLPGLLHLGCID